MGFDGSRAKIGRAKEHLEALTSDSLAFFTAHPYRVVVENPADRLFVLRLIDAPTAPSERWSLLIGDIVHNLRCSLDYVAWEMAGSDPGDTETMFPIFDTEDGWKARAERRIKRLPEPVRALIQQVQPFNGRDPAASALSAIRRLDDADKHKLLTVAVAVQERLFLSYTSAEKGLQPQRFNLLPDQPLVTDAVIGTLVFGDDAPEQMEMEAGFHPTITFGESVGIGHRVAVIPSLGAMLAEASAIVASFERRFQD